MRMTYTIGDYLVTKWSDSHLIYINSRRDGTDGYWARQAAKGSTSWKVFNHHSQVGNHDGTTEEVIAHLQRLATSAGK